MTLQEVKQFLKENAEKDAEVKAYLTELSKVSQEQESAIIENYKKSQDYKSEQDRFATRAITTFKEKTLPGIIEDQVKATEQKVRDEINPPKNPEVVQLTKKMQEYEQRDAEKTKKLISKELKNAIQTHLGSKKIPIEYSDLIQIGIDNLKLEDIENEEKLNELILPKVEKLLAFGESVKTATATEMLSRGGGRPQGSSSPTANQLTKEQYEALPRAERVKATNEGRTDKILGRQ